MVADLGSPQSPAELLAVVAEVDRPDWADRTPLWYAVRSWKRGNAPALIAAGADPWRRSADGRSPGRMAWATPLADLVAGLPGAVEPTAEERAAQEAADALIASFEAEGDQGHGGTCVAFVAGRDAADVLAVLAGLGATPMEADAGGGEDAEDGDDENGMSVLWEEGVAGVSTVPGGAVIEQDRGIGLLDEGVLRALSRGTVAVAVFDHPNAFIHPGVYRDGEPCPGDEVMRDPVEGAPEEAWLYRFGDGHPSGWTSRALAMAAALTGVRLEGGTAWFGNRCDLVLRLPERLLS